MNTADKIQHIKGVVDFLSDAAEALKDKASLLEAISKSVPWLGVIGSAAADVLPPLKFVVKLIDGLTKEADPNKLAYIACTTAYQQAVKQSMQHVGLPKSFQTIAPGMRRALKTMGATSDLDFSRLSLPGALQHAFVKEADEFLNIFLEDYAGYDDRERREIIDGVHQRFTSHLKTLLSHGDLKDRFAPLTQRLEIGSKEEQAYGALLDHGDVQRWLFEEAPLLGQEPFSLADVYVDTDCGVVRWGDIHGDGAKKKSRTERDPFLESCGGRKPLIDEILQLMADPEFKDAIVLQGVAGAGKSSLTLRLCAQLIREGLHPIRVRLRDLGTEGELLDALASAVVLHDERRHPGGPRYGRPEDLFLNGRIFDESIKFRGHTICPYVLVLDGWDELTVSSSDDFRKRLEGVLEKVRSRFLNAARGARVRVIITGRPSVAVVDARFMKSTTPLLTIRPFTPNQLGHYITRLHAAQEKAHGNPQPMWRLGNIERYEIIIDHYKQSCRRNRDHVLGHPLLAYIALRVIANQEGDPSTILGNSTDLYRMLVDMTCARAGKSAYDEEDEPHAAKFTGAELRRLLRATASAITTLGGESISYDELSLRLKSSSLSLESIDNMEEHNVLTKLMISFYFRGGSRDLGCEFAHKSFREYLFAEQVVETLKDCAALNAKFAASRSADESWKDFRSDEMQFEMSRRLSVLLSAKWLEPEVVSHISRLITWEIAERTSDVAQEGSIPTEQLDRDGWSLIRDALADIWDWWAMGVHLRPTIRLNQYQAEVVQPSFANELIRLAAPLHLDRRSTERIVLDDITGIDARIGDGLFRIAMMVHYELAVATGWLSSANRDAFDFAEQIWSSVAERGVGARRRQCVVRRRIGSEWVLLSPESTYGDWSRTEARINAARDRPMGFFPSGISFLGVDFRDADIGTCANGSHRPRAMATIRFQYCNLSKARITNMWTLGLAFVCAPSIRLHRSYVRSANRCCLRHARLYHVTIRASHCDLRGAYLTMRFFEGEQREMLQDCRIDGMEFSVAQLIASPPVSQSSPEYRELTMSLDEWDTFVARVREWQRQDPFMLQFWRRIDGLTEKAMDDDAGRTSENDVEFADGVPRDASEF
ncbi:hypothetical protein WME95_48245 [Sorangium sp. So ce327]|uniref:NACHT domain-containing protein n=1 Tax=Sorangium sp. So ce327 TaxID=3133301 RepID=UPI003F60599A